MINFVCGYIGAGKSTFIKEQRHENDIVIDWDDIKEVINDKNDLITTELVNSLLIICINFKKECWIQGVLPKDEQVELLKSVKVKWYWIDCSLEQAKQNILKRNRANQVNDIDDLVKFNKKMEYESNIFKMKYRPETIYMYD